MVFGIDCVACSTLKLNDCSLMEFAVAASCDLSKIHGCFCSGSCGVARIVLMVLTRSKWWMVVALTASMSPGRQWR